MYTLRPPLRCSIQPGFSVITEFPVPFVKGEKYCMVQADGPVSLVVFPGSQLATCPKNWIMV